MFGKDSKPTQIDLYEFFRILCRNVKTGMPPLKCIETYREDGQLKKSLDEIAKSLIRDLNNGVSLANAMRKHAFFPPFVVELVDIGGKTGQLKKFLKEIVFFLEQENDIRREIKSSMFSVKLLLTGVALGFILAAFVVIPKMGEVLKSLGTELPFITKVVLNFGIAMQEYWYIFFFLAMMGVVLFLYVKKAYPEKIDLLRLKIPFLGELLKMELHYKFYKIVSLCTAVGDIPTQKAFQFTAMAIGHLPLKATLQQAARELQSKGNQSETALLKADVNGIFHKSVYRMLKSGRTSGKMSETLEEEAREYQKDLVRYSKDIGNKISASVVIPVMFLIIIGVASIYYPIFNMMRSLNV